MKISVLVCNYNHGKFITGCLQAILQQSHRDMEVIVIDDASTDDSVQKIYEAMDVDDRIQLHRHKENQGLLKTFEEGMGLCSGDLWMGCGADDLLVGHNFFEKAHALMDEHRDACGVYGISRRVDGDTGATLSDLGCAIREGWVEPSEFIRGFFEQKCFVPGFSVMWRRSMLKDVGGFAMDLGPQFDYWVNHALPSVHGVFFLNEIVSLVRIFQDGSNFSSEKPGEVDLRLQRHAKFEKRLAMLTGFLDGDAIVKWRNHLIYDLCGGIHLDKAKAVYGKELLS